MDECEVCRGRNGMPECTVTFSLDSMSGDTNVRTCRECLGAMLNAMVEQWNESVATDVAEVQAMCEMLGIEFPVAAEPS